MEQSQINLITLTELQFFLLFLIGLVAGFMVGMIVNEFMSGIDIGGEDDF